MMGNGFLSLLLLSLLMWISSFAAGILPMAVTLSQDKIQKISSVGMGVLVSTALVVIIPEGVKTLYSTEESGSAEQQGETTSDSNDTSLDKCVGISLLLGFVFMYLVDVVPELVSRKRQYASVNVSELRNYSNSDSIGQSNGLEQIDGADVLEAAATGDSGGGASSRTQGSALTLGLIIHAAADGVALGASTATGDGALELVVFFAIMIHKAPAAFGLTAVLMKTNLSTKAIRKRLLYFTLSAPIGAIITWGIIMLLGTSSSSSSSDQTGIIWWTGILLIFSGGTFLYVAMHVLADDNNDTLDEHSSHLHGTMTEALQNTALTILGMCLPLLTYLVNE